MLKSIGQFLKEKNAVTEEQIQKCLELAKTAKYEGYKLGEIMVAEELIPISLLGEYLNQPTMDIMKEAKTLDVTIFDALDKEFMLKKKFVTHRKDKTGKLAVCMVNIQSRNERNEISQYLVSKGVVSNFREINFYLSTLNMIEYVVDIVSRRHEIAEQSLSEEERELKYVQTLPEEERPRYFFDRIITKAILNRASDIHIEPLDEVVSIRIRVDGVLTKKAMYTLPKKQFHQPILAIIKTKAELNVAEKRMPQGGSINYVNEEKDIYADLRVSFLNTVRGEKCVIRILPQKDNIMTIDDIGLSDEQRNKMILLAEKPKGMILVTGPTGSGKSTTLYSLLQHINDGTRNVMTAEDPVEMYIEGIHQVQVNKDIEFTFAVILREFLRQDPDVLMVGEIRDYETAHIASQAAETGHLVLSTLHTNSGVETINRLINIGIPVYLLNASLIAVIAQRLVRKLCPYCRVPQDITPKQRIYLEEKVKESPIHVDESFLHHKYYTNNTEGCPYCVEGFRGRAAIYEILMFDNTLKNIISQSEHVDVIQLKNAAIENGHELMYVDGLRKAKDGITSLDELIRMVE